jgi:hypothetical protein
METALPIGHSLGVATDPSSGASVHRVRVGPDVVRLSGAQFAIWALAHGEPVSADGARWGPQAVLDAAAGLPDPAGLLAGLVDDGLVAIVGDAQAFARVHQLKPLMLGLGNGADDVDAFEIGLPGQPVARVDAVLYRLYQWGHLESDLWAACQATARMSGAEFADAGELLDAVLDALPTLLGPNAAYLDRAA